MFLSRGSVTRRPASIHRVPAGSGSPTTTQDSLPVAGQALPDGLAYPQGSNERFPSLRLHLILLSQACVTQGSFRSIDVVEGTLDGMASIAGSGMKGNAETREGGDRWKAGVGGSGLWARVAGVCGFQRARAARTQRAAPVQITSRPIASLRAGSDQHRSAARDQRPTASEPGRKGRNQETNDRPQRPKEKSREK